jgi:hypothetical protein
LLPYAWTQTASDSSSSMYEPIDTVTGHRTFLGAPGELINCSALDDFDWIDSNYSVQLLALYTDPHSRPRLFQRSCICGSQRGTKAAGYGSISGVGGLPAFARSSTCKHEHSSCKRKLVEGYGFVGWYAQIRADCVLALSTPSATRADHSLCSC